MTEREGLARWGLRYDRYSQLSDIQTLNLAQAKRRLERREAEAKGAKYVGYRQTTVERANAGEAKVILASRSADWGLSTSCTGPRTRTDSATDASDGKQFSCPQRRLPSDRGTDDRQAKALVVDLFKPRGHPVRFGEGFRQSSAFGSPQHRNTLMRQGWKDHQLER